MSWEGGVRFACDCYVHIYPLKSEQSRNRLVGIKVCFFLFFNIYIYMVDKNYSSFTKTGRNKGIYQPDEKRERERRAREKRTTT